ncbi:MAG: 2Fe-2S iron-sulfur cluster binding domain-containing protein, partial [Deltaproteobacteria bacterium]
MTEYKIQFLPHNKSIDVPEDETIIRAALEAGVHINASCGGEGVCGKCRIIVESGEIDGGFSDRLPKEDAEKGYRLACRSRVKGNLVVRVPVESSLDADALNLQSTPRRTARIQQMDLNDLKQQ